MASTALSKVYAHAKRAEETLRRVRTREKEATNALTQRGLGAVATLGGLAAAAVIDGKWGGDGKRPFSSDPAEANGIASIGPMPINGGIGLALVAAGIPGFLPGSELMVQFGASMLGYPVAKTIEARVREGAK